MKSISDVNELNKILKKYLDSESEISSKNIRNALSTYGEALRKLLSGKKFNSYELSDVVILFDLRFRNSESNVSVINKDTNTIDYYDSYEFKLTIYGNQSANMANKLFARFNTDYILSNLQDEGVYLERITNPTSINEFVNEVLWPRTDMSLLISCKHTISKIHDFTEYKKLSEVKIV